MATTQIFSYARPRAAASILVWRYSLRCSRRVRRCRVRRCRVTRRNGHGIGRPDRAVGGPDNPMQTNLLDQRFCGDKILAWLVVCDYVTMVFPQLVAKRNNILRFISSGT